MIRDLSNNGPGRLSVEDLEVLDQFICPTDYTLASYQQEIILKTIRDFETKLDHEHEVALKLCHFGETITLIATSITSANPSLLIFEGYVNGQPARLVQHISQLNFLLMAVVKTDTNRPATTIKGFSMG